ncbi:MAG: FAD-dependent oxidoreductase [Alphaproteobacteria bacterium]|nr:FAD-dependent oxidoreductase [Alphaproteobacteria bacterium]
MQTQILILGAGPAGYTAALYSALAGFKTTLLMGPMPGGQLILTHKVENFPGFMDISGPDLTDIFHEQAEQAGVRLVYETADQADVRSSPFRVHTTIGTVFQSKALIIATGATARWLHLPGEDKLIGHGVSVCATCDGIFHKGKPVAVIGSGNTAAYEALFLAQLCSLVYLIYPGETPVFDGIISEKIIKNQKIKTLSQTEVSAFVGEKRLEALIIYNKVSGQQETLSVSGAFEAVGQVPNTQLFINQLNIDINGYLVTDCETQMTSVPGVFACGDVQAPRFRQAIIAAGSGCRAALSAKHFLMQP